MRLSSILLSCMATTSTVLAVNKIDLNLNHGGLFAIQLNTTYPVYSNISKECQTELENNELFEKCVFEESMDTLKENCETIYSDECTKFYNDFMSLFPSCKNEKTINDLSKSVKSQQEYTKYFCTLNGDGNTCPNAIQYMNIHGYKLSTAFKDCPYKSCVDNLILMMEDDKKYGELRASLFTKDYKMNQEGRDEFINAYINYLKSPECTSITKDDSARAKFIFDDGSKKKNEDSKSDKKNEETKSGAEPVKKFTSILLSLVLLYVIF